MAQNLKFSHKVSWLAIKDCTKDSICGYKVGERVPSSCFQVPVGDNITKWYLTLYPNGKNSENSSHLSLYLKRIDSPVLAYKVDVKMWIVSKEKPIERHFSIRSINDFNGGRGDPKFMSHEKFKELVDDVIINGNLQIGLEMTITPEKSTEPKAPTITNDLLKMLDDSRFTDFELKCSDKNILKCHKGILVARSPVFNAMVSNDMEEARQGFVKIEDINSEIMSQVLRFIYSGDVDNLDNIANELIFAAEKYQLDELKEKCIESLYKNLSKENVIEVLEITDKIAGCEKLFEKVVCVVARSYFEISKTEGWNNMSISLTKKLMDHLMAYNSKVICL